MMFSKRRNEVIVQKRAAAGFTLVELMIALVLGLVIIAGVISVFLGNKEAYRTNEGLSQVQDSARTAFEYLVRDIRAAGSNVCGVERVDSVLNSGNSLLDFDGMPVIEGWNNVASVSGSFDLPTTGTGAPVAGSPLVRVTGSRSAGLELDDSNVARSQIKLASASVGDGSILMLCDTDRAVIFQATGMSGQVIEHGDGATGDDEAPGNSMATFPDAPTFAASSYLAAPTNHFWYIGENDVGGHSLYRYGLSANGIGTTEMVRGFKADDTNDWDIRYHAENADNFVKASSVSSWDAVDAVRFTITAQSRGTDPGGNNARGVGADGKRLERTFTTTIAIRNRMKPL